MIKKMTSIFLIMITGIILSLSQAFAQENLRGRKITVITNQPHIRAAEALAKWFQEDPARWFGMLRSTITRRCGIHCGHIFSFAAGRCDYALVC